jgi:2,4-diketo-3-deoxy-L-fuconate hydrolase
MRLARLGHFGQEEPAIIVSDDLIEDWNRASLESGAIQRLTWLDLAARPSVKIEDYRWGVPVARPTKVICVGLNYLQHAIETGATPPEEPIIFMKALDTVVAGFDDNVTNAQFNKDG